MEYAVMTQGWKRSASPARRFHPLPEPCEQAEGERQGIVGTPDAAPHLRFLFRSVSKRAAGDQRSPIAGRVAPDDAFTRAVSINDGQVELVPVCRERDIHPVQTRHFLLPVGAADCRLNHEECTSAAITLEFHAAHSGKPGDAEEGARQRFQNIRHFGSWHAACGAACRRRPGPELAAGERARDDAVITVILQTEIDVVVGTFDPFLNDQAWNEREYGPTEGLPLRRFLGPHSARRPAPQLASL